MAEILKLASQLTFATVEAERKKAIQNFASINDKVTVDLIDVETCDSAGLALLIELKRVFNPDREMAFTNISPSILSLATFCGVEKLLN